MNQKDIEETNERIDTINNIVSQHVAMDMGYRKSSKQTIVLLTAFISLFTWILIEKNTEFKKVQETLVAHSIHNGEMLSVLKMVVETAKNDSSKLEQHIAMSNKHQEDTTKYINVLTNKLK